MILPENWRERIRGVFDNIQFPSLPPKKVLLAAFLSSLVFANERTRVLIGHHSREILHLPSSPSPYSMDDSFGEKYSGKNSAANEHRNQIRGQQIHDKNHDKFKLGRSGSDYNDFPSFRFDLHGECTALGNAYISGRSEAELWVALEPYLSDKDKTLAALGYAATVSFTSPENFDAALNAVLFSAGFRYLDANALTIAALNDRLPILKMIDYTMHSYLSPEILDQAFAAAALNFNSEAMKFLINIGADPELYIRTYQHPISVLEFLVSEKYGINDKMYPLRSEQKRLHSIQLLLSQTMDRSIILAAFNTAASECDYDVLKLFLGVRSIQKFRAVALLFALEKNDCPADVLRLLGGTPQMDTERIPMSMEMDRYTLKSARFFKLISGQEVTTYAAVDKLNGELVAIEVQPAMYGVKYLEILKKAGMMEGIVDYYGTFPGKNVDEEWKVGELMSMDLLNYNFYRLSNGFVSGENRMYEAKSFAKQILPGLVNLRKLQITHNNLNEYSIQVSEDENGNPIFKLDDFSRAFLSGEPPTVNGGYWLTPEYFSGDAVGHPADMWAFGITIFQFLSQDMSISVGDVVNWEYYFGKFPLKFKKGVYKYYGEYGLQSVRPSINYLDPKNVPHDFIDFLKKIMKYDPSKRMTPQEALQHPWLL